MGNNNATASLAEEESSKLETNGISPLENVPVEKTQDQVFLAVEGKDGDKQSESFSDDVTGKESQETEPQSNELVEDPKVTKVEEDMYHNGLVMETDEQIHKNTSVAEGVEIVCESPKVEELSMIGTQSTVSKLNTEESGNEEKPCVSDEIVFVSPELYETAGTEDRLVMNESLEETAPGGKAVKLDQEICMEQRTGSPEEAQEILNLDNCLLEDEVTNEGKADKEISKPGSQGSNAIVEIGFEDYKEERDMELARKASLKRMSRCRSLPVSNNSRAKGGSPVQELVSEVTYPSRAKTGFDKVKTSVILPVSCQTSNRVQDTTEAINESSKEAKLEMRSPSFNKDLTIEERRDEPTEETPLLSQDKTETYKATLDVEEKTVMLKRTETEKIRGFELSLGLSMNLSGRCDTDDSFKETKSSGDNLVEEKPNMSETLVVSCVGSKEAQDTNEVITESSKGDEVKIRSSSSGNDLRTKERRGGSTEHIPLLCHDKAETYEAIIGEEKKTVMLKRSETEKTRGFEMSLGLSMNLSGRCDADESFKETKGSVDNLVDKKASWGSMKGRVRKRSKSSLFGTCLCCNIAMN